MSERKPTKRMLEFLRWADAAGDFKLWPVAYSIIKRRAEYAGFIEMSGTRELGFTGYRISAKGRAALDAS